MEWAAVTARRQGDQAKPPTGTQTALFPVSTASHHYSTWTVPLTSNFIVSRMFRVPSTIRTTLSKLIKHSASRKTCVLYESLALVSESFGPLKKVKQKSPFGYIFHQAQEELFGS